MDVTPYLPETGAVGLLLVTMWLVLRGHLVPRSTVEREQQISDQWRTAAMSSNDALDRQTEIIRQLVAAVEQGPAGTGRHHRPDG